MLISSVRGVGKTSFVHKTISLVKQERENAVPIFVNIGHAISEGDQNEKRKNVLVSLIRAAHCSNDFKKDLGIEAIYSQALASKYTEESSDEKGNIAETNINISLKEFFQKFTTTLFYAVYVYTIKEYPEYFTHISSIFLVIFVLKDALKISFIKKLTDTSKKKKTLIIDNTTSFLEIKFEQWLKQKKEKEKKKIIFVIDELDKVDSAACFSIIKEYKNLFTRSLAHYLFIAGDDAYDSSISSKRNLTVGEGGSIPTFFTHVIYLPLVETEILKQFLKEIFQITESDKKFEELSNYLLIKSNKDFFELKRLIDDLVIYTEDGNPFIDVDALKKKERDYSGYAELFHKVDTFFLQRKSSPMKKFWRINSQHQGDVLKFLNINYGGVGIARDDKSDIIRDLIDFLESIGNFKKNENGFYYHTKKYNRIEETKLPSDDEYCLIYEDFQKQVDQVKNLTGFKSNSLEAFLENVLGIDYSTVEEFDTMYDTLQEEETRIQITEEEVRETTKSLQNILGILKQDLTIFGKIVNSYLGVGLLETTEVTSSINNIIKRYPRLKAYKTKDNTRFIIVGENIKLNDLELNDIRSSSNVLFLNLIKSKKNELENVKTYLNKAGRKNIKGISIDNVINIHYRQLSETKIGIYPGKKHLKQ